jgi:hypothetical protein
VRHANEGTVMRIHPLAAQVLGFIAGLQKHYANATLVLDNKSYPVAELVQMFQGCSDAAAAATAADAQRTTAVKAAEALAAQVGPIAVSLKKTVLAAYASNATVLADFSLDPPRVAVKTAEVKSAAAVKAAATRKALGTKGPQQKKLALKALAATSTPAEPTAVAQATPSVQVPAKA